MTGCWQRSVGASLRILAAAWTTDRIGNQAAAVSPPNSEIAPPVSGQLAHVTVAGGACSRTLRAWHAVTNAALVEYPCRFRCVVTELRAQTSHETADPFGAVGIVQTPDLAK